MMFSPFKKLNNLFYTDEMTRLPVGTVSVIFSIIFLCEVSTTMCFSYLPKMIKRFGVSELDSGYHVGILGSSVYVGWGISGLFWGHMGDVFGHKRTLFIASIGALGASLAFGFSTMFWWALATRSLHGLFMGMSAVGKSILVKVSDQTNLSLAFSIFYSAWTIAFIVGPSVAGFLVFPADQYPKLFSKDDVFGIYPVLLPNLTLAICWVVAIAFEVIAISDGLQQGAEELIPLMDKSNMVNQESSRDEDDSASTKNAKDVSCLSKYWNNIKNNYGTKDFITCIFLYLLVGFILSGIEEMFPVFAATSRVYHGLQLTTSKIGVLLLGAGIILLFAQTLVVPKLINFFRARFSLISASLCLVLVVPLIPLGSLFYGKSTMIFATVIMGVCLTVANVLLVQINVLINNCIASNITGSANGIALAATMIGRIIGPVVLGRLYSWSLTNTKGRGNESALGFPLDDFFIFFVISLSCLLLALVSRYCLSDKIDEPRT